MLAFLYLLCSLVVIFDALLYVFCCFSICSKVTISNKKGAEVSLRVAALEHLGTIAARLRKDERCAEEDDTLQAYQTTIQEVLLVVVAFFRLFVRFYLIIWEVFLLFYFVLFLFWAGQRCRSRGQSWK